MPKISIGDADIYYESQGEGPPLMLVPGLGGTGRFWREQVPVFSKHFRTIVHDHRGCGQSTPSKIKYSVGQMASDALRLMDALKIDSAHYVGHSTGGAMGQRIALEHPRRLKSLVLSATWDKTDEFFRRSFAARKQLLEWGGPAAYANISNISLFPALYVSTHAAELAQSEAAQLANFPLPEILASRIDAIVAHDCAADLPRIDTPTLVVCARDDQVTPFYFSERLAKTIKGAMLAALPYGGHFVPQVDSAGYNKAVLDFLLAQPRR
ncbi:MAG: alpha/beta fold hydrolase [Alphaproteobacteria bacterium]